MELNSCIPLTNWREFTGLTDMDDHEQVRRLFDGKRRIERIRELAESGVGKTEIQIL